MEVEEGSYGAYMISDPKEPLYIVRWEDEPWQAESDGSREVSNVEYKWTKGDWMCRGTWLQRLPGGGRNWYTMDSGGRSCIVPLDRVVNADLDMRPFTDRQGDNPLPSAVDHEMALTVGAWCMSDSDYIFLLEETQVREDVCEYDIGVADTLIQQRRLEDQWHVDHS